VTQLLQGEASYGVVVRYKEKYRNTQEAIQNIRLLLHRESVSHSRN
jgi:cobalt-zinc-cadmium resistance protein CzcA